jgi:hypothetical protein
VRKLLKTKILTEKYVNENNEQKKRKANSDKMIQWIYLSNSNTLFPLICLL